MRFYLWAIVVLILAMPLVAEDKRDDGTRKLTLAESIQLALTNNRQILQGREALTGTEEKISEYKS